MKRIRLNPPSRRLRPLRSVASSALALVLAPLTGNVERGGPGRSSAEALSCFRAGTQVRMADGSVKAIEQVAAGDRVVGQHGGINRVREVERVPLAGRLLYRINGGRAFVTAEHPFMSTSGWRSITPAATARENARLQVAPLREGDLVLRFAGYRGEFGHNGDTAAHKMQLMPAFEPYQVAALEAVEADAGEHVYNLLLEGDNTYIADDYLVHNKGGSGDPAEREALAAVADPATTTAVGARSGIG